MAAMTIPQIRLGHRSDGLRLLHGRMLIATVAVTRLRFGFPPPLLCTVLRWFN
jgi:hypothetical protein